MEQNYTLGKGMLYLARYTPGTKIVNADGYRPIGNVPEFTITVETENLDHFSSMGGVREKDASVPLETNRTSAITTDNINADNLSLFFFGEALIVEQAAATGLIETIPAAKKGNSYFLGTTVQNPTGVRGLATAIPPVVEIGGVVAVALIDYVLDYTTGRFEFLESSAMADLAEVEITYGLAATKRSRIVSGSDPVEGALRYIADNPSGSNYDYIIPYLRVSPNGDLAVITEEWATIPLSLEILKLTGREAVYLDGRPYI